MTAKIDLNLNRNLKKNPLLIMMTDMRLDNQTQLSLHELIIYLSENDLFLFDSNQS